MVTTAQQEVWEDQVAAADEAYMEGADGSPVQADHDARVAESKVTHTEIDNEALEALDTLHGSFDYSQKVDVVGENETQMGALVRTVAQADQLYEKGGPTKDWTADMDESDLSAGVDGLFLAERSKQTGVKSF